MKQIFGKFAAVKLLVLKRFWRSQQTNRLTSIPRRGPRGGPRRTCRFRASPRRSEAPPRPLEESPPSLTVKGADQARMPRSTFAGRTSERVGAICLLCGGPVGVHVHPRRALTSRGGVVLLCERRQLTPLCTLGCCSHSPRSVSQPSILSATACHPGSSIMSWPILGKISASVW